MMKMAPGGSRSFQKKRRVPSQGSSKLEDVLLRGTSPCSLRQLSARFGMILPFLFAVSFSIAIFYFRTEFHELLMPGVSRFASVSTTNALATPEPTPESEGLPAVAPTTSASEPYPESESPTPGREEIQGGEPEPTAESEAEAVPTAVEPEPTAESEVPPTEIEPEPTAESEARVAAEGEPEPTAWSEATATAAEGGPEATAESEMAEGQPEPEGEAAEEEPEHMASEYDYTATFPGEVAASEGEFITPTGVESPGTAAAARQPDLQPERKPVAISTPSPILPKLRKSGASAAAGAGGSSPDSDVESEGGDGEGSSSESEPAYYEVNDAMSAFIGNAGLIFGLIYAFIFGRSYTRFDSIMDTFYAEVSAIHKLVLLVQTVSLDAEAMQAMLDHLTRYTNQCRYEMTSGIMVYENEQVEVMTQLYAIVPALQRVVRNNQEEDSRAYAELNGAIVETMLETIGTLCNLRYQRWSLIRKAIPLVLWVFITLSAMLMFFGVMMMQSGWYNVDFTLCMLTVGGIGLMIYCLADVDQTHTGLMRIPVDRLDDLDFVGTSTARSSFKFSDSLRVATAFRLPRIRNAFMKAGGAGQPPSPTGGDADDEVIKAAGSVTSSVRWAGPVEGGSALPMSYGDAGRRNSSLFASVQKFSLPPKAAAVAAAAAAAITAERDNYQPLNNNANFMDCELTDAYEGEHHRVIDIHPSSEAPSRSPSASNQQRSRLKYGEDAVEQRPFGRTDRNSVRLANEAMNGEVSLDSGFTPTSASLPGSC